MPSTHPPYPAEYRRQIVELARLGRSAAELAREFEPTYETIRQWIKQAERDEGTDATGLSNDERDELRRLRKENRQLRLEREILATTAWPVPAGYSLGRPMRRRSRLHVHERVPGPLSDSHDGAPAGGLHQRVLRVAPASPVQTSA